VREACLALGVKKTVEIPEAERGRAAAFVITAAEGRQLHLRTCASALKTSSR